MGIPHWQGAVGSAPSGVAAVWHYAGVSDTGRQEQGIPKMCDWIDWVGYPFDSLRGNERLRGATTLPLIISASSADDLRIGGNYERLDGKSNLDHRAEQEYIYPRQRPCNHVAEGGCSRRLCQHGGPSCTEKFATGCAIHACVSARSLPKCQCQSARTGL